MEVRHVTALERARRRLLDRLDLIADVATSALEQKNNALFSLSLQTIRRTLHAYLDEKSRLRPEWYPVLKLTTLELKESDFVEMKVATQLGRILEKGANVGNLEATVESCIFLGSTGGAFLETGALDPLNSVLSSLQRAYFVMTRHFEGSKQASVVLGQFSALLHRAARMDSSLLGDQGFVERRLQGLSRIIAAASRLILFQIEEDHLPGVGEMVSEFVDPALEIFKILEPANWTNVEEAKRQHERVVELQNRVNDLVFSWLFSLGALAVARKKPKSLQILLGLGGRRSAALRELFRGTRLEIAWSVGAFEPTLTLHLPPWGEVEEDHIAKFYVIARGNYGAPEVLRDYAAIRFLSGKKELVLTAVGELVREFSFWAPALGTRTEEEINEVGHLLLGRLASWEAEIPVILARAQISHSLIADAKAAFEDSFLNSRWGADALPVTATSSLPGRDLSILRRILLPRDCFVEGVTNCDPAIREMARLEAATESEKFIQSLLDSVKFVPPEPAPTLLEIIRSVIERLEAAGYGPDSLFLDLKTDNHFWVDSELRKAFRPVSPPKGRTFHGVLRVADRDLSVYSSRSPLDGKILIADSKRLGRLESDTGVLPGVRIREPEPGDSVAQDEEGRKYGGWMILELASRRKLIIADSAAGVSSQLALPKP